MLFFKLHIEDIIHNNPIFIIDIQLLPITLLFSGDDRNSTI